MFEEKNWPKNVKANFNELLFGFLTKISQDMAKISPDTKYVHIGPLFSTVEHWIFSRYSQNPLGSEHRKKRLYGMDKKSTYMFRPIT